MPSDVFWTGLFTFGGSAIGAGVGYATARLQRRSEDRRFLLEERQLSDSAAELGRQFDRQMRAERSEVYRRYLHALDGVMSPLYLGGSGIEQIRDRFDRLMEAHCELELVGSEEMNDFGYKLNGLIEELTLEVVMILDQGQDMGDAVDAIHRRADKLRTNRRGLVQLMSADL